jgi:hypothetical protein
MVLFKDYKIRKIKKNQTSHPVRSFVKWLCLKILLQLIENQLIMIHSKAKKVHKVPYRMTTWECFLEFWIAF